MAGFFFFFRDLLHRAPQLPKQGDELARFLRSHAFGRFVEGRIEEQPVLQYRVSGVWRHFKKNGTENQYIDNRRREWYNMNAGKGHGRKVRKCVMK